ncbi:hypothetical protein ILUMI_18164, partial [Ignelater luminosus]
MQEFEFSLMSRNIPFVINPDEDLDPPKFAIALHKEGVQIGSGAIIGKHFALTLCVLIKNP